MKSSTHLNKRNQAPNSDADDRRLIRNIVGGDRAAIAELYNLYYPRLFRFLHRISHDYALTEEVVNDVMLIVWRSAHKFKGSSKVSTWILGIGYRQCMKRLRKRHLPRIEESAHREAQVDNSDTVELNELISIALQELTPEHRMMIESVLYLGMTYQEVAELAGCPVNTAKTRVHNARKKLRLILTELGYRYGDSVA